MKVSVITTLFNYKAYIGDCIRSVVTQNYDDLEMIVVDDGSSDDGSSVVESYANKYPKVRLVRLNKNYGYSTAKNVGIKCAKGDLICMLDADDMLMPDSISLRVNKMAKGHDLVHGWAYNFSKRGRSENEMRSKWIKHKNDPLRWKYIHPQGVILKKYITIINEVKYCGACKPNNPIDKGVYDRFQKFLNKKDAVSEIWYFQDGDWVKFMAE